MPHYFFMTRAGAAVSDGIDPVELPDDGTALAEAIRSLGEMAKDELPLGVREISVTVRTAQGKTIYDARLAISVTSRSD
ncbi:MULTISPECIES: hypothetical protein [unclassified Bosea (in: a-proteobacteria)]|uniref:DUF6894 family protein n=1 Tax=unclassified Bosea (in: a-proteobacteria) TaxID=2653178 RepID=UPI000956A778|nr:MULTISPECIES: hypothetical protein [unclassified Bosea (in: a-proteobacteria)]TAJ28497.1 MAG: hypothetical protein EPO59_18190 [Bosea sp. (in: a-proteobacteria)]SIQ35627.1 hypothetical protein SAMN05880592_102503 [Bosea sp. TND4EK4]